MPPDDLEKLVSRTLKHELGMRLEAPAERRRSVHQHDPVRLLGYRQPLRSRKASAASPGPVTCSGSISTSPTSPRGVVHDEARVAVGEL